MRLTGNIYLNDLTVVGTIRLESNVFLNDLPSTVRFKRHMDYITKLQLKRQGCYLTINQAKCHITSDQKKREQIKKEREREIVVGKIFEE